MDEEKKNPLNRVVFDSNILQKYFPQKTSAREIEDFDDFYIDVDDSSLRKEAEKILGRKIRISSGHEGMIENSK